MIESLGKAATLNESFPILQTCDRDYRHDTVIVSCIWYRGITNTLTANHSKTDGPYHSTIFPENRE
jgi:hypothetical protein